MKTMPYSSACSGFQKNNLLKLLLLLSFHLFLFLLIKHELLKVIFSHHFDFAIHIKYRDDTSLEKERRVNITRQKDCKNGNVMNRRMV